MNQIPTRTAPRKNLSSKNENGGICSNAALVAGNVAPQMIVVRSSASLGINYTVLRVEV
jgi:hypothetical protein